MKHSAFFFIAAAFAILAPAQLSAATVKIIANSSVTATSVSAAELKSVYLREKNTLDNGSAVEPVLEKGGPTHEEFVKRYLGKSDSALQMFYRSLVFSGAGAMPKSLGSDAEVTAYVAKTKGAIGYISGDAPADGVKTLEIK